MGRDIWTKSGWLTRQESITIRVGDNTFSRSSSLGFSTATEDKLPAREHYECLDTALNTFMMEERKRWINEEKLTAEAKAMEANIKQLLEGKEPSPEEVR